MFLKTIKFINDNINKLYSISIRNMSEAQVVRKIKYDGRCKKRQWEERRTDKGAIFGEKKLKEDVENSTENITPFERIKRRKYALLMGYSGQNYFGMQRNPKTKTIEEDLFNALLKANYITREAFDQVQTVQFQRAARTDKGVSAARQVVSMKLPEDAGIEKINNELPEAIRIFGIKRVTKGFNSKSQCDARTYIYLLPSVAFSRHDQIIKQEEFRLDDESHKEINDLLKIYIGTKNYHNFTSKKKPKDPSAKRYMMSFECEKPFLKNDVEFVAMKVKGQSFMLHQIRKMIGLVIAVMRKHTTKETIEKAFTEEKVNVPRAPGLGLLLDFVHYDRYNYRYGSDGMHETLEWENEKDTVECFKEKYIYPVIIDTEINEQSMVTWVDKLHKHSYEFCEDDEKTNEDNSSDEEDEKNEENDDDKEDNSNSSTVKANTT